MPAEKKKPDGRKVKEHVARKEDNIPSKYVENFANE